MAKPERLRRPLRRRVRFISVYSSFRSLSGVVRSCSRACWSARLRSKRNSMRSRVFHAVLSRIPVARFWREYGGVRSSQNASH